MQFSLCTTKMASSSLIAYNAPISIYSRNNNAAKLRLFNSKPLNLSSNQKTPLHFFNRKKNLSLSSAPRPLTITSMSPPGKSKKVVWVVKKMNLEAGKAINKETGKAIPKAASTLGPKGVKADDFCEQYNARTANKLGYIIPAQITDRSFTLVLKAPPTSFLLLRAAGVEKGSKDPQLQKVGKVTIDQLRKIAQEKLPELNCSTVELAMKIIAGTAANMGIDIDPPVLEPKEKKELV